MDDLVDDREQFLEELDQLVRVGLVVVDDADSQVEADGPRFALTTRGRAVVQCEEAGHGSR